MGLKHIRLELARTPEFPEGNRHCGYEFVAPLDAQGHLNAQAWARQKSSCTVRRFWEKAPEEHGLLVHHRASGWSFAYGVDETNDEPIFRFDKHTFVAGEYVSVTEHDGVGRPFRVVSVRPQALT